MKRRNFLSSLVGAAATVFGWSRTGPNGAWEEILQIPQPDGSLIFASESGVWIAGVDVGHLHTDKSSIAVWNGNKWESLA